MADPVARLNAALEGRYAIERELGEGGMATVYLADDLKHERKVTDSVSEAFLASEFAEFGMSLRAERSSSTPPRITRREPGEGSTSHGTTSVS